MNSLQQQVAKLKQQNELLKKQLALPRSHSVRVVQTYASAILRNIAQGNQLYFTLFQAHTQSEKKLTASLKTLKQTLRKSGNSMSVRDLYEHFKRGKVFKKNNRKENFHQ